VNVVLLRFGELWCGATAKTKREEKGLVID